MQTKELNERNMHDSAVFFHLGTLAWHSLGIWQRNIWRAHVMHTPSLISSICLFSLLLFTLIDGFSSLQINIVFLFRKPQLVSPSCRLYYRFLNHGFQAVLSISDNQKYWQSRNLLQKYIRGIRQKYGC